MALARELAFPGQVMAPLERAAETLPEWGYESLAAPEAAGAQWEVIAAMLPPPAEDGGMGQLAAALAGACYTRQAYRRQGIPDEIFGATMGCFRRFLRETSAMTGQWAFDRGFWTWRQVGCRLFRLGTLEFEYCAGEDAPVLHVHIPSDAALSGKELEQSYAWAERFFAGEGRAACYGGAPAAMRCKSWLLAPALEKLLPEQSGIRRFAADYQRYAVDEDAPDFYQWLFQCGADTPVERLPERTSLQRNAKRFLLGGGKIGAASGERKQFTSRPSCAILGKNGKGASYEQEFSS